MATKKKPVRKKAKASTAKKEPRPAPPTAEQARAVLFAENRRRAKACWDEIEPILKKYGCEIRTTFTIYPT